MITIISGLIGIDYGEHWDEHYVTRGLSNSIMTLTFIPNTYFYSGMYFNMGYLAMAGDFLDLLEKSYGEVSRAPLYTFDLAKYPAIMKAQTAMLIKLRGNEFKLRLRSMYVVFSALSVLIMYFAARGVRPGYLEPLAGAALMALSWEINYHSRHIAIDNMMMVFGALVLLCVIRFSMRDPSSSGMRWLIIGSAAVGFAAGAKIIGVLLVVPIIASIVLYRHGHSAKAVLVSLAIVAIVFVGTLFFVSPGIFLDPIRMLNSYAYGSSQYGLNKAGIYYSYYARPYFGQIPLMILYFSETAFSHYKSVSLLLSAFALVGLTAIFREDRKLFLTIISFPMIYLFIFAGLKIMIVRNFLVVLPFMALFVSRGIGEVYRRCSGYRSLHYALGAFILCWVALNTFWLFDTAASVRSFESKESISELSVYMKDNPDDIYYLSPRIWSEMMSSGLGEYASLSGVTEGRKGEDLCALFLAEYPEEKWQANRSGFFEHVVGSLEVNYDYYPTWVGNNYNSRIYVLSMEKAGKIGYNCHAR